jgi:maltose alpha-D-glucosyltransferase/alpha-amylase
MSQKSKKRSSYPAWLSDAVFYEIYPQTFYDSDGDGIGDLDGVTQKLDYVASLGANAIWLNPFYRSPMRDAGYDVMDFCEVDPRYGDKEAVKRLFRRARDLGLRVIIDLVPGHTSIDHPWFTESSKPDAARPYKNWYVWTDSTWNAGGAPLSGQMIRGYSNRDGCFLSNFFWSQPALNFGFTEPDPQQPWQLPIDHEDVQLLWKEMRRIMRFWLELGACGFRVDMADSIIRNDPKKLGVRRFWRETREELEADYPELYLIAEGHPSNLLDGTGFHSAFIHWAEGYMQLFRQGGARSQSGERIQAPAYFSESGQGDFRPFLATWTEQSDLTRGGGLISLPGGNHDLSRLATGQSDAMLEMIQAFVLTWPGVPFIYYGDEIGMRQQSAENPVHEGHYPPRNGARTPMQWAPGHNAAFSECAPQELYLPIDPSADAPNVAHQMDDANSLWYRVRALIGLRREHPALGAGASLEILSDGAPGTPLVYWREAEHAALLCAFFPADQASDWRFPGGLDGASLTRIRGGGSDVEIKQNGLSVDGSGWAIFERTER